ncbi:MAG: Beta-glucanase [Candidatus Ordinivivax streblomastigis]|uniref:Beta-glucanase n=1 Tax=Candidatus Ordinivivax streblomastigis TaxID=2540710 RepID=A0A5M8P1L9_9BACT|nr:MAG: Beta-glucanase [Candidatus Ordinivivax streblomastigis]
MKTLLAIIVTGLLVLASCDGAGGEPAAAELKLNKSETTLRIGEKETLTIVSAPSSNEAAEWSSSNRNVVTVFAGIVTAEGPGIATVTVNVGEYSADCVVTVSERTYQLVWSEEFDGTALNVDTWNYEIGTGAWGWGNDEKQYYTDRPENIRVENGYLIIEARKEAYEGSDYTSARITTQNNKDFTYGKIEAHLSIPSGIGTWPAFWMLGYGGWPSCGEIDIMEHVGKEPSMLSHALHTKNQNGMNGKNWSKRTYLDDAENVFHTYTIEWIDDEFAGYDLIRFYIDGEETGACQETQQTSAVDWPFKAPFYFILNLAIGGSWGGPAIDEKLFPAQMKVDYIRVYQSEI